MNREFADHDEWKAVATSNRINYEDDPIKHLVRLKGWLPNAERIAKSVKRRDVRYLTFCASGAVDIFMLEQGRVLKRGADGRLKGTCFCESLPDAFEQIQALVYPSEEGFLGKFEDIVLFTDSKETVGRTVLDNHGDMVDETTRARLTLKDRHQRLVRSFPFDIINLDFCGPLLPPKQGPVSKLLKATLKTLEWQGSAKLRNDSQVETFVLMLTTQLEGSSGNHRAMAELTSLVQQNLKGVNEFRNRWELNFAELAPEQIAQERFVDFLPLALSKYIVEMGNILGWEVHGEERFLYERPITSSAHYTILSEVFTFRRIPQSPPIDNLFNPDLGLLSEAKFNRVKMLAADAAWRNATFAHKEVQDPDTRLHVSEHLRSVLDYRRHITSKFAEDS